MSSKASKRNRIAQPESRDVYVGTWVRRELLMVMNSVITRNESTPWNKCVIVRVGWAESGMRGEGDHGHLRRRGA